VAQYFGELKAPQEAPAFYDHFQATGWRLKSGHKVADWKATVRNWLRKPWRQAPLAKQRIDNSKDKEQLESWKKEAAPMPKECRDQLQKIGIRSAV